MKNEPDYRTQISVNFKFVHQDLVDRHKTLTFSAGQDRDSNEGAFCFCFHRSRCQSGSPSTSPSGRKWVKIAFSCKFLKNSFNQRSLCFQVGTLSKKIQSLQNEKDWKFTKFLAKFIRKNVSLLEDISYSDWSILCHDWVTPTITHVAIMCERLNSP